MEQSHSDPQHARADSWFSVFAPVLAWALHGALSVAVTIHACRIGHAGVARSVVVVTGAVCIAVAAVGFFASRVSLQRTGASRPLFLEGRTTTQAVAQVGLLSSSAFAIAIILDTLPVLFLRGFCEVAR